MRIFKKFFLPVVCLFLSFSSLSFANTTFGIGSAYGQVISNFTGEGIPAARVIYNWNNTINFGVVADGKGVFIIPSLVGGNYRFTVQAPAALRGIYQNKTVGVTINAWQTNQLIFRLRRNPGAFSGRVTVSPGGAGLSTTVTFSAAFSNAALPTVTTTSDADGYYSLSGLQPGPYLISVNPSGYTGESVGLELNPNQSIGNVNLQVTANPGLITGTVTDEGTTDPIEGAIVNSYLNGVAFNGTTTDASGNYSLSGFKTDTYNLTATAFDYSSATKTVQATIGTTTSNIDFALKADPGSVSGQVVSASTGDPLEGAQVMAIQNNVIVATATADLEGNYTLESLAPGVYSIQASQIEYNTVIKGATVVTDTVDTVNFALSSVAVDNNGQKAALSGTITIAGTETTVDGALIQVIQGTNVVASGYSNSSGSYSIYGIATGTYTITASKTSYATASISRYLSGGTVTLVNLALGSKPGSITGTVEDSGASPIENASVKVIQDEKIIATTLTDVSGGYTLTGFTAGTYTVEAGATGFSSAVTSAVVAESAPTTVDFTLTTGSSSVTGTVTDGTTSEGIAGALVNVYGVGNGFLESTYTDDDGAYIIVGLYVGDFTVGASHPNYTSEANDAFSVTGTGQTVTENLTLYSADEEPNSVTGSVIVNSFLLQDDRIHKLEWTASYNPNTVSYRISRNGTVIANVASTDPLNYEDHNRSPLVLDAYLIQSVYSNGQTSTGVSILLQ